jgi:hypothetical protein
MGLRILGSIQQSLGLLLEHVDLVVEDPDLVLEVGLVQLVNVHDVVITMLPYGATEADARAAVLTETLHVFRAVVVAPEYLGLLRLNWDPSARYTCIVLNVHLTNIN